MMNFLLIAGGAFLGLANPQPAPEVDLYNHTLLGEQVLAKNVVCRTRWGTPMLPAGKSGYSIIAPINDELIRFSLVQPPKTTTMQPFRPGRSIEP